MHKVLIIEDDKIVSLALKTKIEKRGLEVFQVFSGSAAVRKVINEQPDIILLDIGLPEKNGYDVCKEIRQFYQGAIIFLTAQDTPQIEVACFGLGADDFVPKSAPFDVLFERMKRLGIRPQKQSTKNILSFDDLEFNPARGDCLYKSVPVGLTKDEFALLYYIATHNGEVVSRQRIFQVLKGTEYNGIDRSVDIKISRVRNKLKDVGVNGNIIQSIRSKGYLFTAEASLAYSENNT